MASRMDDTARSIARLTKSSVEAVPRPAKGGRAALWDAEVKGFGVRVTPSGARTYVLRYRTGGRGSALRTLTIGQHGSPWTADQARRRAQELLGQVRSGADPAADRALARREALKGDARRAERLFAVVADRWFRQHVQLGDLRSQKDIEGVLERDLKPAFADRTVDEIDREAVAAALEAIGERSGSAANKAHKWLRQMFNWLIDKGVVATSPLNRMSRPFAENARKRRLTLCELVVLWAALERLPDPFRSFYRLLILLGQRLREVADLPWSEIDVEAADWLVPGGRTKNKLEHLVPASEQAIALLEAMQPDAGLRRGPVFTTDGIVPINGFSKTKARLDEAVAGLVRESDAARALVGDGLAPWVVHDLRRSLATGCQGIGIALEVTEALLNHISGTRSGIAGVYQLHEYYDEKADALQRWADLLDAALACWARGDVDGVRALDPARRKRRRRRPIAA